MCGALAFGALVASSSARADEGASCEHTLRIDGPPAEVPVLRAALQKSHLAGLSDRACADARVSLSPRAAGYTVALFSGADHVERDVASVDDAATWVEGWLAGSVFADPPEPEGASVAPAGSAGVGAAAAAPAPPPERDAAQPERAPRVVFVTPAAQIALVGVGSAGSDESVWAGGELSARLHLTRTFWMGAALGADADTVSTGPADDAGGTRRLGLHASARAGARLPVTPRLDVVLGTGAGVTWGTSTRTLAGDDEDVQQGGLFVEGLAEASFRVTERLSLLGGMGMRGRVLSGRAKEDATEQRVPDPMPAFDGALLLGAGWEIGGSP